MRHRAFTLIELLVVITVIAVLAGMAVTSFGGSLDKARLDEAARQLHTTVRYAHRYALTHQRECRIVLTVDDPDGGQGYRVEVESEDPEAQEAYSTLRSGLGRPMQLSAKVRFAEVLIEGTVSGEEYIVTFQPTGQANAAAIQLTDGRRTWSVLIEPNTGRSRIVDEAINQTPNLREDLDV